MAAEEKYVFAHFMVGNTYPYTVQDWVEDIELASSQAIDGFVLNVGKEEWQRDRAADCFTAADQANTASPFAFFFSFDMSSIPDASAEDANFFKEYFERFGQSPWLFKHFNKVVVSTFAGEESYFGCPTLDEGWAEVRRVIEPSTGPILFLPSFFVEPAALSGLRSLDGAFNWNGGWPIQLNARSSRRDIERAKLDSDHQFVHHLAIHSHDYGLNQGPYRHHSRSLGHKKAYMAAVSPWFFTHYGPDNWDKNWIYNADEWLFVKRWEQLVGMRDQIDLVQVISWNDYGESHYIGPIKGAQPNSQKWVDGFSHEPWLHLNRYFAVWFKTGSPPPIVKDQIYVWARPHPKNAQAEEELPKPDRWQMVEDKCWVVVFATESSKIKFYTDAAKSRKSIQVKAGMSKLAFRLEPDKGIKILMKRRDTIVAECHPGEYKFNSKPETYNFNAFVAMST